MKTATNKKEAIFFKKEGIRFVYERNVLNSLYLFLKDIGAVRTVPSDNESKRLHIIRLHEALTVMNPSFNEDVPFLDVYPDFFMDVIYEKVSRNGNNISSLCICFNKWYKDNSTRFVKEQEVEQVVDNRQIEDFDDNTIKSLYNTLNILYSNSTIDIIDRTKDTSYFARVKNEYEKRFKIVE